MNRLFVFCLLSISTFFSCRDARIHEHSNWGKYYEAEGIKNAGFILRDQAHDAVHYYNLNHDTAHYLPASTFKIMLSLVALELGVVQDDKFIIPFDGDSTGRPDWDKDLTLREAFEVSSEPFFKEIARRIGKERLQHFLDTVRYGNQKLGDSVATCWTDNTLKTSADEQVGFVRKLYFNQLPFTDRTQRITRSLMLRENTDSRKLYYKTGWGENDTAKILWTVGFAEYEVKVKEKEGSMNKSDERNYVYFFAQNFEIPKTDTGSKNWSEKRKEILNSILKDYTENTSK
ncbi:MAG: penicillin-binding transpeptidase domain-containing protein [Bacteroidota bacterium]